MGNHPTTTGTQEKQEKSINQNRSGGSNSKCGNTWLPNSKVSRSRVAAFLSDSQALYLYLYLGISGKNDAGGKKNPETQATTGASSLFCCCCASRRAWPAAFSSVSK